jgi:hypothetical protein
MRNLNETEIVELFNSCLTAIELLDAKELIEASGMVLQSEALVAYSKRMAQFTETII